MKRLVAPELAQASAGGTPGSKYAGGHRSRVTPVPIPNTEVKPATADGTAWETVWESRSLPAVIPPDVRDHVGLFSFRQQLRRHTVSHASEASCEKGSAWETGVGE